MSAARSIDGTALQRYNSCNRLSEWPLIKSANIKVA